MKWETLCRRTEYPKLGYIIHRLKCLNIPCRFQCCANGLVRTFHASRILEVPSDRHTEAWIVLGERWSKAGQPNPRGMTNLDDMPDDHPAFAPFSDIQP